jgi:hypothetical protein
VGRFLETASDPKCYHLLMIRLLQTPREHYNRKGFPLRGRPQRTQDNPPVELGKVQNEQQKIGARGRGVGALLAQKHQCLVPILYDIELTRGNTLMQDLTEYPSIRSIVFNKEYLQLGRELHSSSLGYREYQSEE